MTVTDPLYPAADAYCSHHIQVGSGHRLYVAEFGNPSGVPALFLHGGPGSGCSPQQARLFDPQGYRLVQPDQRGCGRSTPHGEIRNNHMDALLDDLEQNFSARTRKMLLDDRSDLTVEIDVLRERLQREGVRLD